MYRKVLVLPAGVKPITLRTTHETNIVMAEVQGLHYTRLHIEQIMCLRKKY
jgi:hypothetical protein